MKKYILIALVSLFAFGCRKGTVKIGALLPLSGPLHSYGEMCLKGLEFAAASINEKGGIKGRTIELIVEDSKGNLALNRKAIEELDKKGVIAVLGPLTTDNVVGIGEYVDNIKLPVITPTATGAKATENREWVWRISVTDAYQGIILAKFVKENLKANSVSIILNATDQYSLGLSKSFENEFKNLGGNVSSFIFKDGDTLFDTNLDAVKRETPDCIFIPVFYGDAIRIIKQAAEKRLTIPFVGGDGLDSPELLKTIRDQKCQIYYSTYFFYNYGSPEVQDFLHKYRLKYHAEPQVFSALGYDAMQLVAEVLNRGKEFSRKEFNATIRKTRFVGVTGTISFLEAKEPRRSMVILKFEPGKTLETVRVF